MIATLMVQLRVQSVPPAEALTAAMRDLLLSVPAAKSFADDWPELVATRHSSPHRLPVLAWLTEAPRHSSAVTRKLVEAIVARADALSWRQSYTAADFSSRFLDRYGWTELVGQRGPIPSNAVACGLLLLGPDTDYPSHAHEAEELYLPLAGRALWMRGAEGYVERPLGIPIHHQAWLPHAMRTGPTPLLALYVWRGGDLAAKSTITGGPDRSDPVDGRSRASGNA